MVTIESESEFENMIDTFTATGKLIPTEEFAISEIIHYLGLLGKLKWYQFFKRASYREKLLYYSKFCKK